ncbi:hypothetical protein KR093_009447, partial [Drosophila rubida]
TTSVCRPRANHDANPKSNTSKTANTREPAATTQTATARRRPIHSLLLLGLLMSQLHQFAGGGLYAAAAPAPAPAPTTAPPAAPAAAAVAASSAASLSSSSSSSLRTRLQKRDHNISFKQRFHLELNSSVLEWSNGCGGNWTGNEPHLQRPHKRCAKHKKLLRTLQNKTGQELRQLNDENTLRHPVSSHSAPDTSSSQAIDISSYEQWKVQSSQYKFLPALNNNSDHLPLRRVHHDLQFYVASFSYLRHAQLHYDYEYLQTQSVLSAELLRYRSSARNVLCLVEEAINATNRLYTASAQPKSLKQQRIRTVQRAPMEKRLQQFKTPLVELHRQAVRAARNQPAAEPQEPHLLDALFLKYHYIQYIRHITHVLVNQRKKQCRSAPATANTNSKSK